VLWLGFGFGVATALASPPLAKWIINNAKWGELLAANAAFWISLLDPQGILRRILTEPPMPVVNLLGMESRAPVAQLRIWPYS